MHTHADHTHPGFAGEQERRALDRRALAIALALVAGFAVVEVVAGVLADSLAVLADAGHMLSDVLSLGLALGASWLASRPPTPSRSFGYRRAEILAAFVNGALLVLVASWVVVEAVRRLDSPPEVSGGLVLTVGLVGLAVNVAAALVLHRRAEVSLNVQAALLHVVADLLGSVGVIVAGGIVLLTGWDSADPLVSLAIAALILWSAVGVLRKSSRILLEQAPPGLDVEEVGSAMAAQPGVVDVHDLHVWTITSGFPSLSAHVLVDADADCHAVRLALERLLRERFGLDHTTLQVEHVQGLIQLGR